MRALRIAFASTLLALGACSGPPSQPVVPATPAVPTVGIPVAMAAPVAAGDASPTMQAVCAQIKAAHDALIAEAEKGAYPLDKDVAKALRSLGSCIPARRGAWAVRIGVLAVIPMQYEDRGTGAPITVNGAGAGIEVVFVEPSGAPPETGSGEQLEIPGLASLDVDRLLAFDFDNDGTSELALCIGTWDTETYTSQCLLLARKNGATRAYDRLPPGLVVRDIDDIDKDGRPDVLSMGPFELPCDDPTKKPCVSPLVLGPKGFLYHQLPDGSFSPTDDVARAHARKEFLFDMTALFQYETPPPGSEVGTLLGMGANAVRGALAFGVDRKKIRAALAGPRRGYCSKPKACPAFDAMEAWPSSPFWPAKSGH